MTLLPGSIIIQLSWYGVTESVVEYRDEKIDLPDVDVLKDVLSLRARKVLIRYNITSAAMLTRHKLEGLHHCGEVTIKELLEFKAKLLNGEELTKLSRPRRKQNYKPVVRFSDVPEHLRIQHQYGLSGSLKDRCIAATTRTNRGYFRCIGKANADGMCPTHHRQFKQAGFAKEIQ